MKSGQIFLLPQNFSVVFMPYYQYSCVSFWTFYIYFVCFVSSINVSIFTKELYLSRFILRLYIFIHIHMHIKKTSVYKLGKLTIMSLLNQIHCYSWSNRPSKTRMHWLCSDSNTLWVRFSSNSTKHIIVFFSLVNIWLTNWSKFNEIHLKCTICCSIIRKFVNWYLIMVRCDLKSLIFT